MSMTISPDFPDQPPIASLTEREWDVVIIGAGPAGAMAGCYLGAAGWRALLIDKARFPRDKVCGDGLIPDAMHCLERAGLMDAVRAQGHPLSSLRVYSPSRHFIDLPGAFVTIKRYTLDAMLVRAAVSRGASLCQGTVERLEKTDDGGVEIACRNTPGRIRAKIGVLATGASMALPQALNMVTRPRANAAALRCYLRSDYPVEQIVVSFDQSILPGYAWIFPVGAREFNVGCGVFYNEKSAMEINLRDMFNIFLREFPMAAQLMNQGEIVSPLQGARLRCGLNGAVAYHPPAILAIGETIGTTFPFTGEGIGKAMETGELAAGVIDRALTTGDISTLENYPRLLDERLRSKYFGYQIAENWLSKDWLCDFMVRRVKASRFLQKAATGILDETVDPGELFSIRGILRSLWR